MKTLAAPLAMVALFFAPACGDKGQTPGPETPPPAGTGTGETGTMTETETDMGTDTGTATAEPAPAPQASLDDLQRDALRTLAAAFNAQDSRKMASLYAEDAKLAGPGPGGWTERTGTAAVEEGYNRLFAAFPDARWSAPRAYIDKDVVIQEWVLSGTQRGAYGALPATDKPAGIHGATVYWFNEDGRIQRQHTYDDAAAIVTQLGSTKGKVRPVPQMAAGEAQIITASGTPEPDRFTDEAEAFYKAIGERKEKEYLVLFAKEPAFTSYLLPEDRKGTAAAREDFRILIRAFPDLKVTAENMWGFGDTVIAETTLAGTQSGAYHTAKATRKPATLHTLDLLRFDESGKISGITTYGTLQELSPQPAAEGGPGRRIR